jgi:hypothetical protein
MKLKTPAICLSELCGRKRLYFAPLRLKITREFSLAHPDPKGYNRTCQPLLFLPLTTDYSPLTTDY